jgi:hydroxymethylglutaryl-CoA lyase
MTYPLHVRVVEVGPRDGLQNEPSTVPAEAKVALIEALADAGLTSIEAGSFVSPKWVPQMADTAEVLAKLRPRPGVSYPVLVPNLQGLGQALACGVREVAAGSRQVLLPAQHQLSPSREPGRFAPVVEGTRCRPSGARLRPARWIAPTEGGPSGRRRARGRQPSCHGLLRDRVSDTIGTGTPLKARRLVERVASEVPLERIALHFHDTYGQALANILACLELGVSVVDSAVAGLGGCPYAQGATGNVATEDVAYMLSGMGIETGIDLTALAEAGRSISRRLNREPASKVARAMAARQQASA